MEAICEISRCKQGQGRRWGGWGNLGVGFVERVIGEPTKQEIFEKEKE